MSKLNLCIRACGILLLWAGVVLPAQTFNTLYTFDKTDGGTPFAGLVQGTDGNFYGTTFYGGAYSAGTIFTINTSGVLTTIYNFCPVKTNGICTDGANPGWGALVQGTDGNFYGTTTSGGVNDQGAVFTINSNGTFTTLYSFCPNHGCPDGSAPQGALVQSLNGDYFFGTTVNGGGNNLGTVFSITSDGTLTTIASLCPKKSKGLCKSGAEPHSGLVLDAKNGNLYGTTVVGGGNLCSGSGCGTAFKITPSGKLSKIHSFCDVSGCPDGKFVYAPLAPGGKSYFYGTTYEGGGYGFGTVFKIGTGGKVTTLYNFQGTDGASPYDAPVQDAHGNLYGTTFTGGAYGYGSVFKLTPAGTLTSLYSFCAQSGCADGQSPVAGLLQGTDGNFYGTTTAGGANGDGTIFEITPTGNMLSDASIDVWP